MGWRREEAASGVSLEIQVEFEPATYGKGIPDGGRNVSKKFLKKQNTKRFGVKEGERRRGEDGSPP